MGYEENGQRKDFKHSGGRLHACSYVWSGSAWVPHQPGLPGLTDQELRAAPLPVSGPVTDVQLRAQALAVAAAALPLPAGAATEAKLDELVDAIANLIGVTASDAVLQAVRDRLPGSLVGGALSVVLQSLPKAREDALPMTWVSAKAAAPGANAVVADTTQLAAGDYDMDISLAVSDTVAVGKGLVVEHRNAANSATTHNLGACVPGAALQLRLRRYTLALNERVRVIAGTAAAAASSMYVAAIGRRTA